MQIGAKGVRAGKSVARFYGAVRNSQAYGVDVHWQSNDTLSVEYLTSKMPPHVQELADVNGRPVHVVIHSGVEDRVHLLEACCGICANTKVHPVVTSWRVPDEITAFHPNENPVQRQEYYFDKMPIHVHTPTLQAG